MAIYGIKQTTTCTSLPDYYANGWKNMPADDQYDEVHEKTKDKEHYGCFNRPDITGGYWAKDGYRMEQHEGQMYGVQKWVWVEHVMSTQCRSFYLWETDPKCVGCTTPKDIAYQKRMESMK